MRFTTLSKSQNTKISSISVQIIMVNCCSWPSSYLYITQELSNHGYNFQPHLISHYFHMTIPHTNYCETWNFQLTFTNSNHTHFHATSKVYKYITVRRLLSYDKCVIIRTLCNSLIKEFKRHAFITT